MAPAGRKERHFAGYGATRPHTGSGRKGDQPACDGNRKPLPEKEETHGEP